jgi:hypothetical protein
VNAAICIVFGAIEVMVARIARDWIFKLSTFTILWMVEKCEEM